jgi:hypothetical protein
MILHHSDNDIRSNGRVNSKCNGKSNTKGDGQEVSVPHTHIPHLDAVGALADQGQEF